MRRLSVCDVLKSQDASKGRSSYRQAGDTSGNQKDRKNYGGFLNAKGAFSRRYMEETEPPLKAVRPTERREESRGLMIQIALRCPSSLVLLRLLLSPFSHVVFTGFFHTEQYHLRFILRNRDLTLSTSPFGQSETVLFLGTIT